MLKEPNISKWTRFSLKKVSQSDGQREPQKLRDRNRSTSASIVFSCIFLASCHVASKDDQNLKPRLQLNELGYRNPGCESAWSMEKLNDWLKRNVSWIPEKNAMPYLVHERPPEWLTDRDYQEIEVASLKEEIGMRGTDHFGSTVRGELVRRNQLMWVDINGDSLCDFISWTFSYDGIGARGEQGETKYYIFFQTSTGFKLIDHSNNGLTQWAGVQQPDAIIPIWAGGQKRPFLVGRSDLYFMSGASIGVSNRTNSDEIHYRSALRWDPTKGRWESFGYQNGRGVAFLIAEFMKKNPPEATPRGCVDTPLDCVPPR